MVDKVIALLKKSREQVMYLIFGGLTIVINWMVYIGLVLFGQKIELANMVAWIVAVLFAYATNRKFVFQSAKFEKKEIVKEFGIFFGSRVATGLLEIVGFPLLYHIGLNQTVLEINGFLAKIIISIIVIVLNYVLSKLVVFKTNAVS